MEINGREINFKRTIWATNAVMQMCPDGSIERFTELFNGSDSSRVLNMSGFICAMSEGYERARAFEAKRNGEEYTMDPLTLEEVMNIGDMEVFNRLQEEAAAAWARDSKVTVETEPSKSKKKAKKGKK